MLLPPTVEGAGRSVILVPAEPGGEYRRRAPHVDPRHWMVPPGNRLICACNSCSFCCLWLCRFPWFGGQDCDAQRTDRTLIFAGCARGSFGRRIEDALLSLYWQDLPITDHWITQRRTAKAAPDLVKNIVQWPRRRQRREVRFGCMIGPKEMTAWIDLQRLWR